MNVCSHVTGVNISVSFASGEVVDQLCTCVSVHRKWDRWSDHFCPIVDQYVCWRLCGLCYGQPSPRWVVYSSVHQTACAYNTHARTDAHTHARTYTNTVLLRFMDIYKLSFEVKDLEGCQWFPKEKVNLSEYPLSVFKIHAWKHPQMAAERSQGCTLWSRPQPKEELGLLLQALSMFHRNPWRARHHPLAPRSRIFR